MEKTKHYLLLREKLESTLLMGQEATFSCLAEELCESPQPTHGDQEVNPASEITTERQRELATKVSTIGAVGTETSAEATGACVETVLRLETRGPGG